MEQLTRTFESTIIKTALRHTRGRRIDAALRLLRPGGRLVFCTCSLLPDEGEMQLDAALARHPGLAVEPPRGVPGLEPRWLTPEGALRLRPDHWADRGGIDGFFIARLHKPEDR
jgi:16S rRNA (cytosine967-C5)-methyltransferase